MSITQRQKLKLCCFNAMYPIISCNVTELMSELYKIQDLYNIVLSYICPDIDMYREILEWQMKNDLFGDRYWHPSLFSSEYFDHMMKKLNNPDWSKSAVFPEWSLSSVQIKYRYTAHKCDKSRYKLNCGPTSNRYPWGEYSTIDVKCYTFTRFIRNMRASGYNKLANMIEKHEKSKKP